MIPGSYSGAKMYLALDIENLCLYMFLQWNYVHISWL